MQWYWHRTFVVFSYFIVWDSCYHSDTIYYPYRSHSTINICIIKIRRKNKFFLSNHSYQTINLSRDKLHSSLTYIEDGNIYAVLRVINMHIFPSGWYVSLDNSVLCILFGGNVQDLLRHSSETLAIFNLLTVVT